MATLNELPRFSSEAAYTADAESDGIILVGGTLPKESRLIRYEDMAFWSRRLNIPVSRELEKVSGFVSRVLTAMCVGQLMGLEADDRLEWAKRRSAELQAVAEADHGLWAALSPTESESHSGIVRLAKLVDFQPGPYDPGDNSGDERKRYMGAEIVVPNMVLEGVDGSRGVAYERATLFVDAVKG